MVGEDFHCATGGCAFFQEQHMRHAAYPARKYTLFADT